MSDIAFIGLGAMGSRMVHRLLQAGHRVTAYDTKAEALNEVLQMGATSADNPASAAKDKAFVLTMLPNDDVSREVWLNPDHGALTSMSAGATAIEISTLTPAWTRELSERMLQHGVAFLEAPVSGSTPQAERGELVFLVGGSTDTMQHAQPVLQVLSSSVQHAGAVGSGALAKLATNTFMAVELATLAEMIGVIERQGADPKQVLQAVSATALWSKHLTADTESMLTRNFATHFPIRLLVKDLGYLLDTAGDPAEVPTSQSVLSTFQQAIAQKLGDQNMTAVVQLFTHPR